MVRKLAQPLTFVAAVVATNVSASAQAPSQDTEAAALLATHRAYIGWHFGDGTFKTLRVTGYVTDAQGERIETFSLLSKGVIYNNTITLLHRSNIAQHAGYTGSLFWQSDVNGFTTPVYGDYAKYLASLTMLLDEGSTELPASFVRDTTLDGKSVGVVEMTLDKADPIDLYIDRQSGAYLQATIDPNGAYETTVYILAYRDVLPGKKRIASYRVGSEGATYTYEKFEPNIPVSDEQLHPPAPTASWSFSSNKPFPVTVTRTRILVNALVNGVEGRFILDTGSDGIVLDDQFADRARLTALEGKGESQTVHGPVTTQVQRADNITFGDATLHNVLVYSEDFRYHDYRGLDRAGYDGLIGFDFFAGAVVNLDLYGSKMTVLDPSATDLSTLHAIPVIVDLSQGVPEVPMVINTSIAVNAMLDTGDPAVALLSYGLARQRHLKIGGLMCGNLDSITLGPITYEDQAVCLWSTTGNKMLLGYDFLRHFNYVFDYPNGLVYLIPNKN
jgi:hypothetical protein